MVVYTKKYNAKQINSIDVAEARTEAINYFCDLIRYNVNEALEKFKEDPMFYMRSEIKNEDGELVYVHSLEFGFKIVSNKDRAEHEPRIEFR